MSRSWYRSTKALTASNGVIVILNQSYGSVIKAALFNPLNPKPATREQKEKPDKLVFQWLAFKNCLSNPTTEQLM